VELFTAVIACNQGRFYEAERVCKRLLQAGEVGDRAAAAHYILGLCDEHAGNRVAAMDSYRAAIKIDPRFAMPHIHLGLLARRAGDTQTARAEMRLAAGLVSCERLDRIVLFGGGFHRNALLELCRAELHAAGESP
jgi:chemotaxis protein methyltransferase CheR